MNKRRWLALTALFAVHTLPFATRPALIGGDEPHYALMAHSLAVDGDVDLLANYEAVEAGSPAAGRKFAGRALERHLIERDGRLFFSHPLGLPALAAPLVAVQQKIAAGSAPDLLLGLIGLALTFLALLAGNSLLESLLGSKRDARLLTFAVFFSTPLWFYSRLFFTESYSWSLAILAVFLATRQRWILASACLGSIFLIKETNLLLIVPILLGTWHRAGTRRAFQFSLGPVAAFALWVLKNLWIYGEPLVTFQPFQLGNPLQGGIGLLLDPRHGLLPFAPVVPLALLGLRSTRGRSIRDLSSAAWAAAGASYLLTAVWIDWTGGSCYGPRLLVPAIPALALPLSIAWEQLRSSPVGRAVFVALVGLGFAIQISAAADPFAAFWSVHVRDLVMAGPLRFLAGLLTGVAIGVGFTVRSRSPEDR